MDNQNIHNRADSHRPMACTIAERNNFRCRWEPTIPFTPDQDAGFNATLRNSALTPFPVLITINLFISNGLPVALQTLVNTTLQPGQLFSLWTWPINIPTNSVPGQAIVYASIFNDYPKNGGARYRQPAREYFSI